MFLANTLIRLWNLWFRCPKKGHAPHPHAQGNLLSRFAKPGELHCRFCGKPVSVAPVEVG